jgi:glyoxylase-like metal-dependent hydrolase (beta-lactamase superfamily II)
VQSFNVGDARVFIFNVGDLNFKPSEAVSLPDSDQKYSEILDRTIQIPCQSVLISLPNSTVLVDPGDHSRFLRSSPEYAVPEETLPPTLVDQLSHIGVSRDQVKSVVITHTHFDHYAGVTISNGVNVPTYPSARHFFGKEDLQNPEMQKALSDRNSDESDTIGVLLENELVDLVSDRHQLSSELEILSAPGETAGHKILKLSSRGQAFYVVGDLFHHPLELEHLSWKSGADPQANLRSKEKLIESALEDDALILAAHVKLGRLIRSPSGVEFQPLQVGS